MNLGPFAGYIWASYAIAAIVIGGLIVWLVHNGRRQAAALAELEARGIKRRSAE
jgi:heme exporter protein D